MLELIQENNVIIGIIIGIITLFITMRQIIISNQKHRMDKEDFISKKPNFSVYIENCSLKLRKECNLLEMSVG